MLYYESGSIWYQDMNESVTLCSWKVDEFNWNISKKVAFIYFGMNRPGSPVPPSDQRVIVFILKTVHTEIYKCYFFDIFQLNASTYEHKVTDSFISYFHHAQIRHCPSSLYDTSESVGKLWRAPNYLELGRSKLIKVPHPWDQILSYEFSGSTHVCLQVVSRDQTRELTVQRARHKRHRN